jgi:hypothetical protein
VDATFLTRSPGGGSRLMSPSAGLRYAQNDNGHTRTPLLRVCDARARTLSTYAA